MRATTLPDRYLSIPDVCERVGVNERTVRGWIAAGVLPANRIGKRLIRIRDTDLDAAMRAIPSAGGR